jgi:Nuclease-related domain
MGATPARDCPSHQRSLPAGRRKENGVTEERGKAWQIGVSQTFGDKGMSGKSPLKIKPLRLPGESVDDEIVHLRENALTDYLFVAGGVFLLMVMEWFGYLTHSERHPWALSILAVATFAYVGPRLWRLKKRVKDLRLGRDGEQIVAEQLECLREQGAHILHDVPGDGFNLDHVVISTRGIYAVETKTRTKPSPKARVVVEGDSLTVAGYAPDRDPISQAAAAARWLETRLYETTGKRFFVRGVVVFPGWFVEQRGQRGEVWVLEPKALPAFIEKAPEMIAPSDVTLAADHLSRYVRSRVERAA